MTKYQVALDELEFASVQYYGDKENHFAVENMIENSRVLQELVDKATPKQLDYVGDGYWNGEIIYDTAICRSCSRVFEVKYEEHYKYCPSCGQVLDWGESDE